MCGVHSLIKKGSEASRPNQPQTPETGQRLIFLCASGLNIKHSSLRIGGNGQHIMLVPVPKFASMIRCIALMLFLQRQNNATLNHGT